MSRVQRPGIPPLKTRICCSTRRPVDHRATATCPTDPFSTSPVADGDGAVIGYVWANDENDAAGWEVHKAGGDEAFNKGARWARKLHDAKARGIVPTAALAEMIQESDPTKSSHVVPGSLTEAPNADAVRRLRQPDLRPLAPADPRPRAIAPTTLRGRRRVRSMSAGSVMCWSQRGAAG